MAQISLSLAEAQKLIEFCRARNLAQYFIAKDQGAYLGASMGADDNMLFYFAGCNPTMNEDWYDVAHSKFGGDDFGERLNIAELASLIGRIGDWEKSMIAKGAKFQKVRGVKWNVTSRSISIKPF